MAMTIVMLAGYFLWPRVSLRRSGRFVLLATTLGMVLYPALSAATPRIELIILYAGIAGFFQGGLDLVFFDTTSLYFEGLGPLGLAKLGKSKDHRPDHTQIVMGLLMRRDGLPVACEIWPGW